MRHRLNNLSPTRLGIAAVAVFLIIFSWQRTLAAEDGLIVRDMVGEDGTPIRYLAPVGAANVPGVIIAHGFAGSRQLMFGFGYGLARVGYGVILPDFDGHGASRSALDREGQALQRNLSTAYDILAVQPEIDRQRIAVLGHSMGSGAVMTAAIERPERYRATIAVSPTGAAVSPERPRNLLLMAGSLEPQFLANARDLLEDAGGPNEQTGSGKGRALIEIPNVEHITILFSRGSHQAALDWLNRTFDLAATEVTADRRMVWFAVHLGGWLLLLVAAAPLLPPSPVLPFASRRRPWHWLGLPLGALSAAALFFVGGRLFEISTLGGLLVGGALGLWFLALGVVWLALGTRPPRPMARDALGGMLVFAFLTVAFGMMADRVWLPWWLTPERLVRWPVVAAAALPWLLASALVQQGVSTKARAGWWLFQSVVIVAGLGLTVAVSPGLFFVVLLMPVFPLVLGILSITGAAVDRPWATAAGGALFFGWLLVAVFPLA